MRINIYFIVLLQIATVVSANENDNTCEEALITTAMYLSQRDGTKCDEQCKLDTINEYQSLSNFHIFTSTSPIKKQDINEITNEDNILNSLTDHIVSTDGYNPTKPYEFINMSRIKNTFEKTIKVTNYKSLSNSEKNFIYSYRNILRNRHLIDVVLFAPQISYTYQSVYTTQSPHQIKESKSQSAKERLLLETIKNNETIENKFFLMIYKKHLSMISLTDTKITKPMATKNI